MHHTKRDPRVSPSDEEREVTDELHLVSVKSATQEKDPNRRILQKRKGKLDMDVKGTDEKTETDQTSSDVKLKSVLHKRQNYASFSDEPSNVKSELSPKPAKQVHLLTPVGESSQQNEEKTPRSISDILRTVSSNNQGQPERPMRLQRRSSTISPSSHYKRKTTMLSPREMLKEFVTSNIKMRRCRYFIRDEKWSTTDPSIAMCCCGRSLNNHQEGFIKHSSGEWTPKSCTVTEASNSFGQVEFTGYGQAKKKALYVRLDYRTDPEIIWKLLTEHWRMKPPNVLISVTGGAKDFILKDRLRALFHRGLMKAATSTGAWIITGGTAEGVMKIVGEAVDEEAKEHTQTEEKPVYALGIATWGIVDNKDALDGNKNKHLWPAYYPAKDLKGGRNTAALDSNHTHFILVDNGTCGKYGADIELRAALEKYIADEKFISDKQVGDMEDKHCERVPVVLVVVEGGPNTLKTVYESTEKNMPAVIVEGSGRAADIIAYAYKKTKPTDGSDSNISKDVDREDIRRRIVRAFKLRINDETQKTVEEYIDWVESCISRRNLITVFRIQDADHRDIDGTILYALLKARSGSVQTQLNLALAWNRADISRQEIFAPERRMEWQDITLEDAMLTALILNRVEFVEVLLDHGIFLKRFLTIKRLHYLYQQTLYNPQNSPEEASVMTVELVKVQIALRKQRMMWPTKDQWNRYLLPLVGSLLTRLMGDEYPLNYSSDIFVVDPSGPRTQHEHHEDKSLSRERDEFKFEYAEKELFLWAVLMNRREMSRLFWQWGSSHIGGALVAGKLLRALSKIAAAEEELELSQDLRNHSMEYQLLGRDVLTECYNRDKKKSQLLVVRELPHWGHTTCMSIADSASQMEFMDHSCCQNKLNRIWKGNMHLHTSYWRLILAVIPCFIFLIKFSTKEEDYDDEWEEHVEYYDAVDGTNTRPQLQTRITGISLTEQSLMHRSTSRKITKLGLSTESDRLSIFRAIYYFYTAPVTKFILNGLVYVMFLVMFSFFTLTDLRPASQPASPGKWEWLTMIWVASLALEEGRQILVREAKSLRFKIRSWFDDVWNRFDLAMILLYSISITLRFSLDGPQFMIARIMYSITLMVFMFRLLHMGFFQKEIGPKIIMIKRMLQDMLFFVIILIVFMMAFGVACEALLYPNHEPSLMLIPKVIYKPYWQMYGELFLEEIEGRLDNETCQAEPRLNGHCPPMQDDFRWVVPFFTGVYMLLSNVLLLNLLIAMFSYIFQKVNDKSETIWRFYRYELIYEYFDRPTLVPPLIFFNHIWRLYWYIVSRCRGSPNPSTDFKLKLDEDEVLELNNFEKKQVDNYFIKKQKNTDLIPEIRMQKTGQRLDQVMLELEDIRESVTTGHWGGTGRISDSAVSLQDVARKVMSSQRSPSESFISGLATDNTDSRNDELKERVEKLEGNMENIIDLLNSIQTTQQEMIKVEKEKVLKEAKEVHHVYYTQTPQTKHSKHNLHDDEERRQLLRLGSSFEGVDTTDHAEPGLSESTYKKLILQGSLPLSPGSSHAVSIDKVDSDYQRQPPLTYRERLLQGSLPTSPASTVDGDLDTGLTHQKKLHRHPTSSSLPHAVSTEYEPQTYRDQLLYGTAPSLPSEAWLSKSRIKQKEKPPSQLSYREQLIHGCPKSGTDEHHSDSNL